MLNKIKIYLERQIRISSLTCWFSFFFFWNRKLRNFWKLIWIRKWNSEFKLRVTHSLDFPLKLSCHLQNTFSLLQAPHFNCFPNYFVMVLYKRTTFKFLLSSFLLSDRYMHSVNKHLWRPYYVLGALLCFVIWRWL